MLFANSENQKKMKLDVLTFEPNEEPLLVDKLKGYVKTKISKKALNYKNYENLNLQQFLAISLFLIKDEIKGFSSVWNREFYPKDTVRIFNRWWTDESIRKNSNTVCSLHAIKSFEHQLYFAKKHNYEWAFISREKNKKVMARLSKDLTVGNEYSLIFHDQKIPVCYPKAESCWQWVAYTNLQKTNNKWSMLSGEKTASI